MARRKRGDKDATPRHDLGYKRLFSHPTMVEQLIRGFLQGDWIEQLDFSTLQRVGNSFVSDDLRERHSDLIWRLKLHGDGERWIYLYLLLEFQSTSDPFMAVRLLTYVGLLLEEIIRKESLKPGDRLPAVLPLVLHNGRARWRAPLRLETLFAPVPKELRRHLPRLTYLLLDERRLDLDRPELKRNPTAAFFRLETNEMAEALPHLYQRLDGLLPTRDAALRRAVRSWFDAAVRRAFPDAIIPEGVNLKEAPMLEENLIRWRDKVLRDADEIRREAHLQAYHKVLLKQMTLRFGRLPREIRRKVEAITSITDLDRLTRKVLSAKSLEEMDLG